MRIGWLADQPNYMGGAEYEEAYLRSCAPEWAEVIICPADKRLPEADAYVVHNCVDYSDGVIEDLSRRPVIKRVHDVWSSGDVKLRRWLLAHSKVVLLSSPLHCQVMRWRIDAPIQYIPSAMNAAPFEAAQSTEGRIGTCWIGRIQIGKGLNNVQQWAIEHGEVIDVYGYGQTTALPSPLRYCGELAAADVPGILSQYQRFIHLPTAIEPFGRTVIEAWLAGCELVVNGNIGALWWIQNKPDAISRASEDFWQIVKEAVN